MDKNELPSDGPCYWTEDWEGNWSTTCGREYCFGRWSWAKWHVDEDPDMIYCHKCGQKIEFVNGLAASPKGARRADRVKKRPSVLEPKATRLRNELSLEEAKDLLYPVNFEVFTRNDGSVLLKYDRMRELQPRERLQVAMAVAALLRERFIDS